ncbi:thymidine phosphorylase [Pseudodesulfovibrio thermohalotolerans]|uniref:thymidine phosphorylase n=1 Tax=Pseudodesulfovibrio thermohalotolerans TaxID=2880651 RepID=UPI0024420787|nr:thymidine phosphorylase [Pseudodesulfovibrio thermohalotolerans]WFS62679.1 thymidine phosphorylase [Pseudodesulfovibrio thermohalotolerans]
MMFIPQETIRKKRDGLELNRAETRAMVRGITDGSVSEGQVAAFAMAVYFRGMTLGERVDLTEAMRDSGRVLDWPSLGIGRGVADKHSTGGVGDKVSLVLGPLAAACGLFVPMISGRGLGHTGGTLDKFDAIPGYDTAPGLERFAKVVREAGCAIIGQTVDLAPADRRLYAVRDVTATVESIDLITASILSKKLAAGLGGLVMDVKFGSGAFMREYDDARELARSIVTVAEGAGVPTTALLTDMNEVLGHSVGNAVEVREAVEFLTSASREPRLAEVVLACTGEMLVMEGAARDMAEAARKMEDALASGTAAERFGRMVAGLGGPKDFVERADAYLDVAPVEMPVLAEREGFVAAMDCRAVGMALVAMGGGRTRADQSIDHGAGMTRFIRIGGRVEPDTPLCVVHARDGETARMAADRIRAAISIGERRPPDRPVVRERITAETAKEAS